MLKVSFIVPVYKVEDYIKQCVDSICCQSYRNIEVILVDDGSPDSCPQICDHLAESDQRIRVVHKDNGGSSDARNLGLLKASGDYVVFIDGDDFWVGNDSLGNLIKEVEKKTECDYIGFCGYYYYSASQKYVPWTSYPLFLSGQVNKDQAMCHLVATGSFPMSACLKIIKRDFLINNSLFFKKGQVGEDIPWYLNVLDNTSVCSFVNMNIYAYRQNVKGSISNSGGEKSFHDLLEIVETEVEKADNRNYDERAKKALLSFLAYELCILLLYKNQDEIDKKRINRLLWLIDYDINPKVKIVKRLKDLVGISITVIILNFYNYLRKRFSFHLI